MFWRFLCSFTFLPVPPYLPSCTHTRVHKVIICPFLRSGSFLWVKKWELDLCSWSLLSGQESLSFLKVHRWTLFSSWLFVLDGKWICHCNSLRIKWWISRSTLIVSVARFSFSLFQRCWLFSPILSLSFPPFFVTLFLHIFTHKENESCHSFVILVKSILLSLFLLSEIGCCTSLSFSFSHAPKMNPFLFVNTHNRGFVF